MIESATGATTVAPVSAADQRRQTPVGKPDPDATQTATPSSAAAQAVERTLKALEPPLMGQNERLSISRDEATGTFIYRSVDKQTGEVLRQWPAESMLQFKAHLRQEGLAYDHLA